MTCTEEEKIQWFNDTVGSTIAKITLTGDRVEEIVVVDDLYDVAAEALTNISLPADFPEQEGVSRDQLSQNFADYCKQIMIRTATVEQLSIPDETIPVDQIFIRPVTTKMKFQGFINQWDQATGFTESLRAMGTPFDFSLEEKKLFYGISVLLNCLAANNNSTREIPASSENMFTME